MYVHPEESTYPWLSRTLRGRSHQTFELQLSAARDAQPGPCSLHLRITTMAKDCWFKQKPEQCSIDLMLPVDLAYDDPAGDETSESDDADRDLSTKNRDVPVFQPMDTDVLQSILQKHELDINANISFSSRAANASTALLHELSVPSELHRELVQLSLDVVLSGIQTACSSDQPSSIQVGCNAIGQVEAAARAVMEASTSE